MNKFNIKRKGQFYEFYWGKKNVTDLWMDFFSSLSMDEEKDCVKLFIKKEKDKEMKIKI